MNNHNYLEDIRLWSDLLRGERLALSELFRKYYQPLLNYGLSLISNEELVKDSIQELFYTIWKKRDRLSNIDFVRSYLYSSIRRMVYRQAKLQESRHERDQNYIDEMSDDTINIEDILIFKELTGEKKQYLKNALSQLSGREKEAIFLKFYNGLTNEEIATIMGVNKQSVYNYIYRSILHLREVLKVNYTN